MRVLVAAAILIAFAITQMCAEIEINPVYGKTPEDVGTFFMDVTGSDPESFVSFVEIWTMDTIKYRVNIFDRWAVKSAQRAINDGYGDCSERAQVMHAILSSQGIQSAVIWGEVAGTNERHEAVEVYYEGKTRIIGNVDGFQKKGTGLVEGERLVD